MRAVGVVIWLFIVFVFVDCVFYIAADRDVRINDPLYKLPGGGIAAYLATPRKCK